MWRSNISGINSASKNIAIVANGCRNTLSTNPLPPNRFAVITAAVANNSAHTTGVASATNNTRIARSASHPSSGSTHSANSSGIETKITVVATASATFNNNSPTTAIACNPNSRIPKIQPTCPTFGIFETPNKSPNAAALNPVIANIDTCTVC